MVEQNHFYFNHPEMADCCLFINREINKLLSKVIIRENEISFDLLLPFLFEDLDKTLAKQIAMELRVHREIIDCYNSGNQEVSELLSLLQTLSAYHPVSFGEYQYINLNYRTYINGDLGQSYLLSTKRVYYRIEIFNRICQSSRIAASQVCKVREFSAYLLFDDDVCDLEHDVKNRKHSILIQYLQSGKTIENAINEVLSLMDNYQGLFGEYVEIFKTLYK